jgi:hypothetical protein
VTEPDIACTLEVEAMPGRLDAWRLVLAAVSAREPVDGGLRLTLAEGADVAALAELVAAEQACCRFFAFALTVDQRGLGLEVRAPDEARELVDALFGDPAPDFFGMNPPEKGVLAPKSRPALSSA